MDSQPVSRALGSEDDLAENAMNILETLGNLTYLIQVDARDPSLVRSYANQAEERLVALRDLLCCVPSA
jgi:hypothetical protein